MRVSVTGWATDEAESSSTWFKVEADCTRKIRHVPLWLRFACDLVGANDELLALFAILKA